MPSKIIGEKYKRKTILMTCPICLRVYKQRKDIVPSACSLSCARRRQWLDGKYGNYKGGRISDSNGYIRVLMKGHHRQNNAGYVLEHILVMENILGRRLSSAENVHHINGDRKDNNPKNLELWHVKQPKGIRVKDYHCSGCVCT